MSDLPLFDPFKVLAESRQRAEHSGLPTPLPKLPQELPQPPAEGKDDENQLVTSISAASATSAGVDPRDCSCVRPRKEEEESKTSIISNTYARKATPETEPARKPADTPARVARVARISASDCSETIIRKNRVARVFEPSLREWRQGLESLSVERPPCPGYRDSEWPHVLSRALGFLDIFGEQAEALGWTAPRLFGVHPEAGIVRVDCCGALVLPGAGAVRAITATEIAFSHLTHREKLGQSEGVPLWEFGR